MIVGVVWGKLSPGLSAVLRTWPTINLNLHNGNCQLLIGRIFLFIIVAALLISVLPAGSSNKTYRLLACIGVILFSASLVWHYWLTGDYRAVFRKVRPTFVPPPYAGTIPPVEKTVLLIIAPKKVKIGESAILSVEFYQYTTVPYLDFSDTILKYAIGSKATQSYNAKLETPSFEFTPKGEVPSASRLPLRWTWVLEPKSLGHKEVLLYLDEKLYEILATAKPRFESPCVISIDVVSEIGLSSETVYWLQKVTMLVGFVLTIPFLIPVFTKIGKRIAAWVERAI